MPKPTAKSSVKDMKDYIRIHKLNKAPIRLGMKRADMISALRKLGHWDGRHDKAPSKMPAPKEIPKSRTKCQNPIQMKAPIQTAQKKGYTIITDNCFGVGYMKQLNRPYESPFFSVYILAPDYIKLLENFDKYMRLKPVAQRAVGNTKYYAKERQYPVLLLGDIEIHFAHEKGGAAGAISKWDTRKKRMNMDKSQMFVKMDDRDKFTKELGMKFLKLKQFPHKKLFVSTKWENDFKGMANVVITDYKTQGPIGTTLEKRYPIIM